MSIVMLLVASLLSLFQISPSLRRGLRSISTFFAEPTPLGASVGLGMGSAVRISTKCRREAPTGTNVSFPLIERIGLEDLSESVTESALSAAGGGRRRFKLGTRAKGLPLVS